MFKQRALCSNHPVLLVVEVSRAASTAGSLSRDGTTSGRELRGHQHWCCITRSCRPPPLPLTPQQLSHARQRPVGPLGSMTLQQCRYMLRLLTHRRLPPDYTAFEDTHVGGFTASVGIYCTCLPFSLGLGCSHSADGYSSILHTCSRRPKLHFDEYQPVARQELRSSFFTDRYELDPQISWGQKHACVTISTVPLHVGLEGNILRFPAGSRHLEAMSQYGKFKLLNATGPPRLRDELPRGSLDSLLRDFGTGPSADTEVRSATNRRLLRPRA